MGRANNQIATHNDLYWMEQQDMLHDRIPKSSGSNLCISAGDIRGYANIDEALLIGYPNNRLVPYQKIQQRPIFRGEFFVNKLNFAGDTTSKTIFNYWGYSWSITWKKYSYWESGIYEGTYREDTTGTWFTASPTSGTNATTINMTIGFNDTPASRYVILQLTSGSQVYDFYIYQNANPGVPTKKVVIAYSDVSLESACQNFANVESRLEYYIEDNTTWNGAEKLYTNIEGTTLAPTGFYSNGAYARHWSNENQWFSVVGQYQVKTVECSNPIDPVDPDPVTPNNMITLARWQTVNSAEYACTMFNNNVTQTYFIPHGYTWSGAQGTPVLYTDMEGTNTAPSGWYSDGVNARLWIKETGVFQSSATC